MSDMPSAREHALYDVRRKRAGVATLVVLVSSFAAVILTERFELWALVITALFAQLAMPAWVGVAPTFPVPTAWQTVSRQAFTFVTPIVGVSLFNMVLAKGNPSFLSLIPVGLGGALVYGLYQWRYLNASMMRVRGVDEAAPLIQRLWRHYLGYAAGLSAGILGVAATEISSTEAAWLLAQGLLVLGFVAVKALIDFAWPQPPLKAKRFSIASLQLAAMSVLWFGLPWGALLASLSAASEIGQMSFASALAQQGMVVAYVAVASIVVFAAIAVIAFVMELFAGEG